MNNYLPSRTDECHNIARAFFELWLIIIYLCTPVKITITYYLCTI